MSTMIATDCSGLHKSKWDKQICCLCMHIQFISKTKLGGRRQHRSLPPLLCSAWSSVFEIRTGAHPLSSPVPGLTCWCLWRAFLTRRNVVKPLGTFHPQLLWNNPWLPPRCQPFFSLLFLQICHPMSLVDGRSGIGQLPCVWPCLHDWCLIA